MSRRSSSGSKVAEHRQKFQGQNYGNVPTTHTTPSPVESTTSSRRSSSTSVADAGSGSHVTGVRSGEVSPRSDRIDSAGLNVAQSPRSVSGTEMFPPHHHDTHRVGEVAPTRKTTGASPRPPLPRTFQLRIDDTSEAQYLAMTSDMTSSAATTAELHETDRYHHQSDTWTWNTSSYAGGTSTPTSNSSLNVPKWNSDLHHQQHHHHHLQQQPSSHSTNFDELASSEYSRKEVRDVVIRDGDAMNSSSSNHSNAQVSPSSVPTKVSPAAAAALSSSSSSRDRCSDRSTASSKNNTIGWKSQQQRERDVADGYIGFANLPNQVFRKAVKKGFDFTLIVVGESGLGKSTLINSMFMTELYSDQYPGPTPRTKQTVQVDKTEVLLKENGVQLRLTVVDTPGFGDAVDNSSCWQPVVDYIDTQFDEFLNNESRINRQSMPDTRVHCCLYFVSPNGHGLKALDVEFMKQLHTKVNVVPIIAKADTLTVDECRQFKKTIMNEIERNNIQIYEFPDSEDVDENVALKKLKERVPFAVVGSNTVMESQGRRLRGRKYPWGIVEVDNLEHNDFVALRNMLIRTNLQDLKEVTNNVHYENFRYNRLASAVSTNGSKSKLSTDKSPLVLMEEEKRDHLMKLRKMEADMEQVFEAKVKEKKLKLKDSEADLQKRMEQTKRSLEQQEKDLQDRRDAFEAEKQQWEEHRKLFEVDSTSSSVKKKKLFNN